VSDEDGQDKDSELPSREEEKKPLIEYPTVYTFKVIGKQEHGFRAYVGQLFKRLMGTDISPDSISEQPSSQGKYLSVSVSVYLLSEEQRVAIYTALKKEKRVLYYL
jgi:putative lipoic acid-binding regulatory protein